jgi:signal transduction histidine kinase/CheY-like chemotaxis protein
VASKNDELAAHVIRHLIDIAAGRCSITEADILACRADADTSLAEILTGLRILHQDLVYHDGRRAAAEIQRVRLIEEQFARKEAETANRMKDEFLVTLSHELRTPLGAILGWSQLLLRGQLSKAQAEQGLEAIERNAKVQAQLIEDLLDVSRIISGKLRIECRPVLLPEIASHAIDVIRPAADAKGVRLKVDVQEQMATVSGDPDRLQQVIWNLLSNAVKFTPKGGWVRISLDSPPGVVRCVVEDSGQGIDAKFLPYIFDRFAQADSSTTRANGGLGLGLAIVRHLVETHGGSVNASSSGKGQGAKFTVILPAEDNAAEIGAALMPAPASERQLSGRRLLIVDDHADELGLLTAVLQAEGAEVSPANSAAAAFESLLRSAPDVLISDIAMPGQDGYELIRRVRALPPEAGGIVPAVAVTAHARVEDEERALAAGFQAFVSKPVELQELVEVVVRLTRATVTPNPQY